MAHQYVINLILLQCALAPAQVQDMRLLATSTLDMRPTVLCTGHASYGQNCIQKTSGTRTNLKQEATAGTNLKREGRERLEKRLLA